MKYWSADESVSYDDIFVTLFSFPDVEEKYYLLLAERVSVTLPMYGDTILGYYKYLTHEYDEALEIYQKLIDKDEQNWIASYLSAEIYYERGNWKQAIKSYEFALKGDSQIIAQDSYVFFNLGWCYGKIKDYKKESNYYEKCLDVDENTENALNNLGYSYIRQKRYEEALNIFNKCIEERRDGKFPYNNKVRALKGLKRYEEALEFIEDVITDGIFTAKSMATDIEKLNRWIQQKEGIQNTIVEENCEEVDLEVEITNNEPIRNNESEDIGEKKSAFATPNERVLEELLENHILNGKNTFDRNLIMYEDDRYYGRQLIIPDIGRIDLLTIDSTTNDLVVIELKQGRSDDVVVGQILRYMGWLTEKLAKPNQKVKGIICVNEITPKLKSAVSVVPSIELYEYGISLDKK